MRSTIIILFLIASLRALAQDSTYFEYALVLDGNEWRPIDRQGNFIFERGVTLGGTCSDEGLIITCRDGKCGYIDLQKREVLPRRYDAAYCFNHGFARVVVGDKWGFIDRNGNYLVQPVYDYAGDFFRYDLAGVIRDGRLGFIDTTGALVIPFKYKWYASITVYPQFPFFTDGLIPVIDGGSVAEPEKGKLGFMNVKGELAIPAIYDFPGMADKPMFHHGKAVVFLDGKGLMIDTMGRKLADVTRDNDDVIPKPGNLKEIEAHGHEGLINDRGDTLLRPIYSNIGRFSEGFAAVQVRLTDDGVVSAFIDSTGKFVFGRMFGFVYPFSEGLAAVEVDKKWGYIDTAGRFVIKPQFEFAETFMNGRAVVTMRVGKKLRSGMIDRTGTIVVEPKFLTIRDYAYGLAVAQLPGKGGLLGGKQGYIDERGEWAIPPHFYAARGFERITFAKPK
jgi:hypothetical protein